MISRKIKLLSAVVGAAALIASAALARTVHNRAAPADQAAASADQGYDASPVFGPDGILIGAAPNPRIRSQLQRDGLPE